MFGYGDAQLRQTMSISGMAAVAGVIVTWTIAQGTASSAELSKLAEGIVLSPTNLLVAAVFGLTPGLLVDRLNAWAKTNVSELEETQKGEGPDAVTTSG